MVAVTASEVLRHTDAFVSHVLSRSELRRSLVAVFRRKSPPSDGISLKPLKLAAEALENAISSDNSSIVRSSLRLAKKLLLSCRDTSFSSFLLALVYGLGDEYENSASSLLDIFYFDPTLARSEIAPIIFEELFLVHLLSVFHCFNEQRSKIGASAPLVSNSDGETSTEFDVSVVFPSTKSLSKMSNDQASELKEVERRYEEVLNENCRIFANYFKKVLANKDETKLIDPPLVILESSQKNEKLASSERDSVKTEELGFSAGRYNPIWTEEETSAEIYSRESNYFPFRPRRVSANVFENQKSSGEAAPSTTGDSILDTEDESSSYEAPTQCFSSDSEAETEEKLREMALFDPRQTTSLNHTPETSSFRGPLMANSDNQPGRGKQTPPKDFVCPITSNLFDDPVTLETGQTYERKAIREWLDRGNATCPITRQKLQSSQLPKTNYVLKRLIASWKEENSILISNNAQNSQTIDPQIKTIEPLISPNSVLNQVTIDSNMNELRRAINRLTTSDILEETESAVLCIQRVWQEANVEDGIRVMLSKAPVINGFVEILLNSVDPQVLKATIFLLSELGSKEKAVIQTLTRVESDVDCLVALFKKGLLEAVVLIYLLGPSPMSLMEMDIVDSLLKVIKKSEEDSLGMHLKPRTAAVILLGQIFGNCEDKHLSSIVNAVISERAIERIVGSLEADWTEEKISAVVILLRCIRKDGKCRNVIADNAELGPVLECFMSASDGERYEIVQFLSELVKLNRRTSNEQILHIIKDEGYYSTMHAFLIYLQTASLDQSPVVAGLLLQLDLLTEPRKMSIYREEAIDTLISCLRNSNHPSGQVAAAETIMSLQGRFCSSGKSITRAFLLKRAGLDKSYKKLMRRENPGYVPGEVKETAEEEKVADEWESKMAFVLVNHEFGLLFEALVDGFKSKYEALQSASFVSATWLTYMLKFLPDTEVQGAARVCLLKPFISVFTSTKDIEDKMLALLALNSFIRDHEGVQDLTPYLKDVMRGLRELKKSSPLASEIQKVLSDGHDSSTELWSHKELVQVDCSENGEVLSLVYYKDKIFSGHSDGTIKVWTGRGSILHLVQEIQEHSKAVTSLAVSESAEILYSGSLDRTVKVWSIGDDIVNLLQVHDLKDQVHLMVIAKSLVCFIPHGAGVKVHSLEGESKLLNASKHAKCLALQRGKLYCGCHDNSIQEIDLATGTLRSIQNGSRKLLGKSNPVQALEVHGELLYSASCSLDGAAVKIWNASNHNLVGSLPTTSDVRSMAISSDLVYLGCKGGSVEIWNREKQNRLEILQTVRNCKVMSMALDDNEDILVVGTSDGLIQAWGLS